MLAQVSKCTGIRRNDSKYEPERRLLGYACAESFFKSLKTEWLYDQGFKTRQEAKDLLFEYIEVFYNRKRSHSSIGYESPESFELKRAS